MKNFEKIQSFYNNNLKEILKKHIVLAIKNNGLSG